MPKKKKEVKGFIVLCITPDGLNCDNEQPLLDKNAAIAKGLALLEDYDPRLMDCSDLDNSVFDNMLAVYEQQKKQIKRLQDIDLSEDEKLMFITVT